MDTTSTSTSRRRVVQGIAWAAPAVAMTAAAPAFAASKCTPTVRYSGGPLFDWGNASRRFSVQQFAVGGQVWVDNLPAGTAVTRVTEQYFIQNIDENAEDPTGDGYWYIGSEQTNWAHSGACTQVGCSVTWNGPVGKAATADYSTAPKTGWEKVVTNSQNNVPTEFSNGKTYNAWDVTLTWTPAAGSGTTTDSQGCNDFTTGPSGKFGVNYVGYNPDNPTGTPGARTKATGSTVASYGLITIYLKSALNVESKLRYKTQTSISVAEPVCDPTGGNCI